MFYHQMDPNNVAVYYYYRFPSRLTLRWQLTTYCVSGHPKSRIFGSWASENAKEQKSMWHHLEAFSSKAFISTVIQG